MWMTKRQKQDGSGWSAWTSCRECDEGLAHCHATLVVHADGTVACEGIDSCGGDAAQHEWWVPCHELQCGCTGDEHLAPELVAA